MINDNSFNGLNMGMHQCISANCPCHPPIRTSSLCPHCNPKCPHGFPADGLKYVPFYPYTGTIISGPIYTTTAKDAAGSSTTGVKS